MEYSNSNVSGSSSNHQWQQSGARGVGSDDRMPSYGMPSYTTLHAAKAGLYDVFA
jgi:hypothetical protein